MADRPRLRNTSPEPDSVSAYLDDAARRWEVFGESDAMPRLLAAVEAVLALVDPPMTVAVTDLDGNWESVRRVVDCGKVREAISRALLREGETDD